MSHVKVADGRFRTPFPRSYKLRVAKTLQSKVTKGKYDNNSNDHLFLLSNTPAAFLWEERKQKVQGSMIDTRIDSAQNSPDLEHGKKIKEIEKICEDTDANFNIDEHWTRKETSCDVEIDVNGKSINFLLYLQCMIY